MEARTNYREALDEFLTCFICNARYNTQSRRPLALFCGHTFCSSCVPHFKLVFGQLNCPIDHINEVRTAAAIPPNQHLLGIVGTMEIACVYHPNMPADFYAMETVEPLCEGCYDYFSGLTLKEMKELVFPDFLLAKIEELTRLPAVQQGLRSNAALQGQVTNVRSILNNEKQKVLYALQNLSKGLNAATTRQLPVKPTPAPVAPTHYRLVENNVYEICRFRRIVPPATQATEESKQWWVSANGRQVDAMVVWASVPINLCGIGLGKEVVPKANSKIEYVDVLRGTTTQAQQILRQYTNTAYSGPDPQVMQLYFSQAIPLRANEKCTIKVKPVGRGMFYGDPSSRIEPLEGPNGSVFYFDDPAYEGGDFQNGQSKWAGPIVKLYFTFGR